MSALTEQVAREHWLTMDSERRITGCHCKFRANPSDVGYGDSVLAHIAEVTEQQVRAQVAAQIRSLEYTREQADEHVRLGGTVTDTQWYDSAVEYAAQIAEGEQ